MTRIVYKILGEYGEIRGFIPGGSSLVEIKIEGVDNAILTVGAVSKRVIGGTCHLDLSHLLDGEYTPYLTMRGATVYLEKIKKQGENLTRPHIDLDVYERALVRIENLEATVGVLSDRIAKLEKRTDTPFLFNN